MASATECGIPCSSANLKNKTVLRFFAHRRKFSKHDSEDAFRKCFQKRYIYLPFGKCFQKRYLPIAKISARSWREPKVSELPSNAVRSCAARFSFPWAAMWFLCAQYTCIFRVHIHVGSGHPWVSQRILKSLSQLRISRMLANNLRNASIEELLQWGPGLTRFWLRTTLVRARVLVRAGTNGANGRCCWALRFVVFTHSICKYCKEEEWFTGVTF